MKCRLEELPFLADYARDNFLRDQADFVTHSPEYKTDFLAKFDPQLKLVEEAMATSMLIAQHKNITERITKNYDVARNWANKIENYAKKAFGDAGSQIADFGFKNLRIDLKNKNDEGLVKRLKELLQHADAHIATLQPKGFTPELRDSFKAFIDALETDIKSQSRKIDERKFLVKDNNKEYEALWEMINTDLLETGKVIYKEKNKEKVKDYTYTELIKKIRIARKKEATDEAAATANKATGADTTA
jgi:hypothetical protein